MAKTLSNRARWGLGGLAVLLLLPAAALASGSPCLSGGVTRFLIYGLAAVSLDLVIGYGAMVSFGHALYLGLGAYSVGVMSHYGIENGWLHLAGALGACAVVGLVSDVLFPGDGPGRFWR
ncbi:hypothetical protein G6F24_017282 [Rhizopus arrhizus]|nr:hypothetical protein G6F24_017282 [Rhizopus arrhizus]